MDNDHSADVISTFDCNILRDAFRTSVIENRTLRINGRETPRF
ncbi:hypothetical protein [Mesorhizobium sp. B2-7-2]|nr:hypothetical protein [Mesorhizobium sp. B2-7-2]